MPTSLARDGQSIHVSAAGTVAFGVICESDVNMVPIYDEPERVVVAVRHTLSVHTRVNIADGQPGATSTDEQMLAMEKILLTPGGQLRIEANGLGDRRINIQGNSRDVRWGPHPRSPSWKPCGGARTANVHWVVEWEQILCEPDVKEGGLHIMEHHYRLSVNIDRSGYSRRTIHGTIKIPQSRPTPDSRKVQFSVDEVREKAVPQPLKGFRRESQDFQIDSSKNVLTYTLVDAELPINCPPPGIVDVQAHHELHSVDVPNSSATVWQGSLAATCEVAKDWPLSVAYKAWLTLVEERFPASKVLDERLAAAARAIDARKGGAFKLALHDQKQQAKLRKFRKGMSHIQIASVRYSEPEIHGRRHVSCGLTHLLTRPLWAAIEVSGLWEILSDVSDLGVWDNWQKSLGATAMHPRGAAKLRHLGEMDALIDLCSNEALVPTSAKKMDATPVKIEKGGGRKPQPIKNEFPPPEESWIIWDAHIRIETTDETVEMKPLPKRARDVEPVPPAPAEQKLFPPPGKIEGPIPGVFVDEPLKAMAQVPQEAPNLRPHRHDRGDGIVQVRAQPSVYARFWGMAVRAGYPIPIPNLKEVGGVKALPANRADVEFTDQYISEVLFGVPTHVSEWSLRYLLAEVPKEPIEVPRGPLK